MYDTHSPTEWAQMVSLAVAVYGALSVPYFVFVDADLADFDPRPAVRRAVESGAAVLRPALSRLVKSEAVYLLFREWDIACRASREALRDAAALLLLLTTSPKGALS